MKSILILLSVLASINVFAKASQVTCKAEVDTSAFFDKSQEMILTQTFDNEIDVLDLKIESVEFHVAVDKNNTLIETQITERDEKGQPLAVLLLRNLAVTNNAPSNLSLRLQTGAFSFASLSCSIDKK